MISAEFIEEIKSQIRAATALMSDAMIGAAP
jgi:hypothetical protein